MSEPLEGKTLLVTGATGFIGKHLVKRLRQVPEARLVLLSRRPSNLAMEGVTWIVSDCRRLTSAVWRSNGVSAIDYVFHLAAEMPKTTAAANLPEVYEANIAATNALLESLPSAPRRFVLASTIDLYGPLGSDVALNEDTTVGPQSNYGSSKVKCEELVTANASLRGYSHAVLRYGHIYGPGEQAFRKVIPETIHRLLRSESPVIYGDGSAERDYLFVSDAVEATVRAAIVDPVPVGPINIVRGESYTIRRIVETLVQIIGFPGSIQYLTDQPCGHSFQFDNHKMRAALGKWPFIPLEDGLQQEVNDFRTRLKCVLVRH